MSRQHHDSENSAQGWTYPRTADEIIAWVEKNISFDGSQYNATEQARNTITQNEPNPLIMLYSLVQEIARLRQKEQNTTTELQKAEQAKKDETNWFQKILGGKKLEIESLNRQIREDQERIQQLEHERDQYKQQRDDSDARLQRTLVSKAEERRDKSSTYIMNDSRPLDFQLKGQVDKLSQQFYKTSCQLLSLRKDSTENRTQEIAEIYKLLSEKLLLDTCKNFPKIEAFPGSEDSETTLRIAEDILQTLNLTDGAEEKINEIRSKLHPLWEKSCQLVKDITSTELPGELFVVEIQEQDTQFDPEKHKAMQGCHPHGKIEFTVYPGYRVSDFVHQVPIVFTSPK